MSGPREQKSVREPDSKVRRMTTEEFQKLAEEAKARGESITPLVREFVLATIDEVMELLEKGVIRSDS